MYKCEIDGCEREAVDHLCEYHMAIAQDGNHKVIVCENCGTMIAIKPKEKWEDKYEFALECDLCDFLNPKPKGDNGNEMETGIQENKE